MIGKLYMARGMTYKMRGNLGKHKPRPVPAGLDWDAWVGPAKMVEYSNFHHRRWYWIANFASGDVANQTVHDIDKIRWGLGLRDHPVTVMCMGDRYVPGDDDDADTPNTQAFLCKWADHNVLVTFEIRHWYTNSEAEMRDKYPFVAENQCVGEIFFGSEGYMIIPDYISYYTFLGPKNEPGPFKTSRAPSFDWANESVPHFQNWIARDPQPQARGPQRRRRGRPPLRDRLPPGQDLLQAGPQRAFRSEDRAVRQRSGGRQVPETRVPAAVRDSGAGVTCSVHCAERGARAGTPRSASPVSRRSRRGSAAAPGPASSRASEG